ncbi:MAG: UPF0182 family protein [Peptococcaceae bacterium]|nr:UPF0182 family protein [Peptococcaceae bacterium]
MLMKQRVTMIFFIILAAVLILAKWASNLYVDWLWFQSVSYQSTFLTIILSELGLKIAVGTVFFLLLFFNLLPIKTKIINAANQVRVVEDDDNVINMYNSSLGRYAKSGPIIFVFLLISIVMAFFVGTAVTGDWVTLQKFLHPTQFGQIDPVFGKDIGFYVFQLPFYEFIYKLLIWSIIIIAFWVTLTYFVADSASGKTGGFLKTDAARYHLSFLAAVFFIARAIGYKLDQYNLLHQSGQIIYGPGYTDIHANLLAYKILLVISIIIAIAIIINIFLRKLKLVVYSIVSLIIFSILLGGIYPVIVQKFYVLPNELNKEKPYIENSIKYTRMAYNLDQVEKKPFPAGKTLNAQDIQKNRATIESIRLWDYRPLQQTYSQIQEMRTYYELKNIDVDRYFVNGKYRQLMISPREMNQEQLPENAKTWVNEKLKYTHGYGVVASPVNEVTPEGMPKLFIKDIPPVSNIDIKITRPEIYFGELTDNYVIVNTKTDEFDFPRGEENAYNRFAGKTGVYLGSIIKRALFALTFSDYKLLLSTEVTSDSQILYNRNITERVKKIAPFLKYDNDPYVIINDKGKLFWIWDAYTTTDMYPYSEPFESGLNYIRNSVKVVVDAYDGNVKFYVADQEDPIIKTYQKIFGNMFTPLGEMPAGIKAHIRYPEDIFMIQASKYQVYHMEDPEVFYNKEDKYSLPIELVEGKEEFMEAYYTIVELPGEGEAEFVQILPFTPHNKINMISWLAGRSDTNNYGKLLLYEFPKQELLYGPRQIDTRINQDSYISQQMSLWNQKGSKVIRGNLLVIPIKDALIYVQPLYLQAEQSKMPELRRVIVAHGDRIVMEPTLDLALQKIFGEGASFEGTSPKPAVTDTENTIKPTVKSLAEDANRIYQEGLAKLKAGDWAGYGKSNEELREVLKALSEQAQ